MKANFYRQTFLSTALLFLFSFSSPAQMKINPQVGFTFQSLSDDKVNTNYSGVVEADFTADLGFMAGADFRFGSQVYFQPGLFYSKNGTISKFKGDSLTANEIKNELTRSALKMKALMGVDLVHKEGFKIRLNAGPTYDLILDVENSSKNFDQSNYTNGSFNLDAGLGVDIWFISAELGYSYGLTEAYESKDDLSFESKYTAFYISVGVVFGDDEKKKHSDKK